MINNMNHKFKILYQYQNKLHFQKSNILIILQSLIQKKKMLMFKNHKHSFIHQRHLIK